jgi:hypothetical protein
MASIINHTCSVPSDTVYVDWELKKFKTILQKTDIISRKKIFKLLASECIQFESGVKVRVNKESVSSSG